MDNRGWNSRQTRSAEARRLYEQERLIVWATETIAKAMDDAGKNKADLAKQLGTSRANITQLLSGSRNMTLRSLSDLAFACDQQVSVELEPLLGAKYIGHQLSLAKQQRRVKPELQVDGLFEGRVPDTPIERRLAV